MSKKVVLAVIAVATFGIANTAPAFTIYTNRGMVRDQHGIYGTIIHVDQAHRTLTVQWKLRPSDKISVHQYSMSLTVRVTEATQYFRLTGTTYSRVSSANVQPGAYVLIVGTGDVVDKIIFNPQH
jgi:hypothetical protein